MIGCGSTDLISVPNIDTGANLTLWSSIDILSIGWDGCIRATCLNSQYDARDTDDQVAAGRVSEDGVTAGVQDELH